jgi:hypothetical protein
MPCQYITPSTIVCTRTVIEYKGWRWESHPFLGPMRLRKDGEPAKRQGRRFYEVVEEWEQHLGADE